MNKLIAVMALMGALAAPTAQAQLSVGGAWGNTWIGNVCSSGFSCDKSSTGHRLSLGYRISPVFSVEVNHFDFGRTEHQGKTTVASVAVDVQQHFEASGLGLGMEVRPSLGAGFYGIGRWGLMHLKGRSETRYSLSTATLSSSDKARSSNQMYVGLGLGYALWDGFTVELSADLSGVRFDDGSSINRDLRLIGLGATYRF